MKRSILGVLLFATALVIANPALAAVWYVDGGIGTSGDGTSWGTAFQTIQEGINAAAAGPPSDEIWVRSLSPNGYVLSAQIDVNKSVLVFGGFDGTETARQERDWAANKTTIDGNLATRCLSVTADGVTIDGFTITQGRSTTLVGAGLENNAATTAITTIQNCIFDDNDTTLQGGAIDSRMGHMIISSCTFKNNDATTTQPRGGAIFLYAGTMALESCSFENNTAGSGGALNLRGSSGSVTITNCLFKGNTAYRTALSSDGGAILSDRTATITGCTFLDNHAIRYGGVIASYCPTPNTITFRNCLFANNSAGPNEGGNAPGGGAIAINDSSTAARGTLNIANCSFSGNSANGTGSTGGAIYIRSLYTSWTGFTIANSILWGDSPDEIFIPLGGINPTVSYSDVQGGYAGIGNINLDPLFVSGFRGAFYLSQLASGQGSDSPCVDAGDPATGPWGWASLTTRTDQVFDTSPVDMGYHYAFFCAESSECDDGNLCTTDECVDNSCTHTATTCDDESVCTTDSCDPATGCVYTPISCNDEDPCTDDSCDPVSGCVHSPVICYDGKICTTDMCEPMVGCEYPSISCDDLNACTTDTCEEDTGCVNTPINCDDQNACTDDSCDSGIGCVNVPIGCDDTNVCTADACDPATGCQHTCRAKGQNDTCCEDPACKDNPICEQWGPVSVVGLSTPSSDALNYLSILLLPGAAVLAWKRLGRKRKVSN